jgi:hypothetical protein
MAGRVERRCPNFEEHPKRHAQGYEKIFSTQTYKREIQAKAKEAECCRWDKSYHKLLAAPRSTTSHTTT